MESVNPIAFLIDEALNYVRQKDPSWNNGTQPVGFKATVVERWKRTIKSEIWNDQVRWSLPIGDREFFFVAGIFYPYDMKYNPFLHTPLNLRAIK